MLETWHRTADSVVEAISIEVAKGGTTRIIIRDPQRTEGDPKFTSPEDVVFLEQLFESESVEDNQGFFRWGIQLTIPREFSTEKLAGRFTDFCERLLSLRGEVLTQYRANVSFDNQAA